MQPRMVQHFLEAQATQLAQAAMEKPTQVRFTLPDLVVVHPAKVGEANPSPSLRTNASSYRRSDGSPDPDGHAPCHAAAFHGA